MLTTYGQLTQFNQSQIWKCSWITQFW